MGGESCLCVYFMYAWAYACWLTLVHLHIRDGLPLVHGDEPPRLCVALALLAAAAQVYDQLLLVAAQGAEDGVEARLAEPSAGEEEGRDDDLLSKFSPAGKYTYIFFFPSPERDNGWSTYLVGAGCDPLGGVGVVDAAADLQPAGPRRQGLAGGVGVSGPEHYDVGAAEVIVPVEGGEVGGRVRRDEVCLEGARGLVVEGAAHDLLDLARVQIYAGAEYCHFS